ncbi:MAG: PAS domain S-box protein [Gammaproteobacteria bacterium]|nr:PAS domain S-box protein [Gammaproteobacteria bacterium]
MISSAKNRSSVGAVSIAVVFLLTTLVLLSLQVFFLESPVGAQVLLYSLLFILLTTALVYTLAKRTELRQRADYTRLRESETRFRALVESALDWSWEVDAEGVYTYCSPQCEALLDYRPDELIGKTPFDLMPAGEALRVRSLFADIVREKREINALVNTNLHKSGCEVVLETSGTPIISESGGLIGYRGVDRDVTARMRTEMALRDSEQRLRDAQCFAKLGHWELDLRTKKSLWSDEVFRILGVSRRMTPGPDTLRKFMNPADWPAYANCITQVQENQVEHHAVYRIRREDGEERWIECRARPFATSNGEVHRLLGVIQDITERKQAEDEKERMQRELQQAHKMEALGELSGGIAHDFNNLLGIIIGYTGLAGNAARSMGADQVCDYLSHVENAGARAKKLVSQLLAFSRSDASNYQVLQPLSLIGEDVDMLRSTLPTSIQVQLDAEQDLPELLVDPVQLQQVILNLGVNARDAMHGVGRLTIRLRTTSCVGAECSACHQLVNGEWLELSVSDSGSGISAEVRERLFDPFFTTKPVGQGTGMGLALVDRIVHGHNGHILVATDEGAGVNMRLLFPPHKLVCTKPGEELDNERESFSAGRESVKAHGERVLVVDDESELTEYLGEILHLSGFEVVVSNSSRHALELFLNDPQGFDLLISDQTMPELSGVQLCERLRSVRPDLPVILCSGFSEVYAQSMQHTDFSFMSKPVDAEALIALAVRLATPMSGG